MVSQGKNIRNLFLIFVLFSLILAISNIIIDEIFYGDKTQKVALENGVKKSKERERVLKSFINSSKDSLHSLRESKTFKTYLENPQNNETIKNLFLYTAKINPNFMQLRYIDKNGQEQIRVDRGKEGKSINCETCNNLQNKATRYYFKDSKNKELEKVWFSAIDLNKEKGKIQIPYKPTFRAILPIKHNGEFSGILIINYFMESFIKKFTTAPLYDMIIFDNDGYSIYHFDSSKSWGKYIQPQYNISSEFPNETKKILSSNLVHTNKFVSRKFDIPVHNGINIMLQLNKAYLQRQIESKKEEYIVKTIIIVSFSFILIAFIIKLFSSTLLNLKQIEKMNKTLESKVEEKTKQISSILDLQDNIVLSTDHEEIKFANKKFFNFLGYKDLDTFQKAHSSISELFINNDRYFFPKQINLNWIYEIEKLPQSQRIVAIMGNDFHIHAFSVSVNKFERTNIITLTDISETMIQHIKLEEKTIVDKLTGAYNREYFEQNYQELINESRKNDLELGLALLDIDHFKIVNDTYGHDVGDEVLKHFVNTIHKYSRSDDILVRWGGEEFIMIFKVKSKEYLETVLEHLRKSIEQEKFPTIGQKTCSIGATIYQNNEDIEKTIKRADEAVYHAKENGRNKVVIK